MEHFKVFGKVMIPAMGLAFGALVKVIVNLTLIPTIGINGAVIGSIASSLTAMIIEIVWLYKTLKLDINYNQTLVKPLIATLFMGGVSILSYKVILILFNHASIATVLAILIAVIVYFFGIIIFKVFDREDWHMLPYGDKIYKFLGKLKLVKLTNA